MTRLKNFVPFVLCLPLILGAASCGSGGVNGQSDPIAHMYSHSTTKVVLEIDYQQNAPPATGMLLGMDIWNLFYTNATQLFSKQKTFTVPSTLSQMESLSGITGTSFTAQQILDIANKHRNLSDTADTSTFYFLYLNGYFNDGMTVRQDVLGVSIGKTSVIAMFRPVIDSSSGNATTRKYVEQSTLIHEFGHAVGLVNNGISMASPHQDTANGAHDLNQHCVMYYANEGALAASQFVNQYITTGNEFLFDSNCQADVLAHLNATP